jgi:transposase
MKPYSKDLRLKVLAAVDRGMSRGWVAEVFDVSQVVVLDNLGAHRPKRVRELIEEQGLRAHLLAPLLSPDLKWDEKAEIMLR